MPIVAAENSFRRGLAAIVAGDPAAAAGHFQSAILAEIQHGVKRPEMRYLSFYGLSRARAEGVTTQAIQACETAARRDACNPDLFLNLGRVYLLAGKTTKALAAFQRGLALDPNHKVLWEENAKIDRRQPPPLSVVPRSHPLNKMIGKLRSTLMARGSKPRPTTRASDLQ